MTTFTTPAITAPGVTVWHGDCIQTLRADENGYDYGLGYGARRAFPDESVDAIVTDPPYGLEFMGKEWDGADGFRRSLNAADAGRDNVFGRSSRTSPEYRAGHIFQEWVELWAAEALRVLKPGGHMLAFGGSRTWHRLAAGIEDAGFEIRDSIAWLYGSGFPKSLDVSKAIDKAAGAEREVIGRHPNAATSLGNGVNMDGGKAHEIVNVTTPATDAAREWEGWGTALKPAFEPIVVARKPLAGTVAQNVLTHGTGALHIDACRIPTEDDLNGGAYATAGARQVSSSLNPSGMNVAGATAHGEFTQPSGRWPTNVVIDEHTATELDRQAPATGGMGKASGPTLRGAVDAGVAYGAQKGLVGEPAFHGDGLGGASKFFPTFRYQAKPPKSERPLGGGVAHPTVKPVPLVQWLMRLVTPPGGTVLDLFAGSGTAVEAALLEQFEVVVIEREAEYLPLIDSRIDRPMIPSLLGGWA